MIKARGRTAAGEPLLLLGLSGENVTRLAAGEPVYIEASLLEALGLPKMAVAIVYGRTEEELLADLKAHGADLRTP